MDSSIIISSSSAFAVFMRSTMNWIYWLFRYSMHSLYTRISSMAFLISSGSRVCNSWNPACMLLNRLTTSCLDRDLSRSEGGSTPIASPRSLTRLLSASSDSSYSGDICRDVGTSGSNSIVPFRYWFQTSMNSCVFPRSWALAHRPVDTGPCGVSRVLWMVSAIPRMRAMAVASRNLGLPGSPSSRAVAISPESYTSSMP